MEGKHKGLEDTSFGSDRGIKVKGNFSLTKDGLMILSISNGPM